ncbi:MAG: polymer-forming cytoskeletal protein [Alphaproteobacteria bacterium]|jgi:cytoskeletal protein CcmA (bactofilin family)|nr:polymer-forming cytoskeletal protein [Alphaproteobacteria bacterium]MBT5860084.1 polymer-forming cytoskeletal protein [Alphaproteobacteria bacterium]
MPTLFGIPNTGPTGEIFTMQLKQLVAPLALAVIVGFSGGASAQDNDDDLKIYRVGGNLFIAGEDFTTNEDADDNAFLIGGNVVSQANYGDDLFVAGGNIEFTGEAGDDLFIGGGNVQLRGPISDNLYAAGGTINLTNNTTVGGAAFLAGGTVTIDGDVNGALRAGAGVMVLNGRVGGDAEIDSEKITIGPNARIDGTLIIRTDGEVEIDPGAVITGGVTELDARDWDRPTVAERGTYSLGGIIALTILAAVLHMVAPGFLTNATQGVSGRPLASVGIGLLTAIGGVIAAVIFAVTIIGIPVTVLLLTSLAILAMLGSVVAAFWAGSVARGFTANAGSDPLLISRIAWTLVGFAILAVIGWIPVIGEIAVGLVYLAAFGATAMAVRGGLRRTPQPTQAT